MDALPLSRQAATLALVLAFSALSGCAPEASTPTTAASSDAPYRDVSLPAGERVEDLLSRMDLADKIGQMTQAERADVTNETVTTLRLGSVLSGGGSSPVPNTPQAWADMYDAFQTAAAHTPLGIPILYGIDAVHGNNALDGATVFPHNIGLGATRDPELVRKIGQATAEEVAAIGIDWTFSPCLCVVRDDRWGRSYESFGEDPALVASMATIITGYQGDTLGGSPTSILATAKHFIADGGTSGGTDQGDAVLSDAELRATYLPPYRAAVEAGVASVMVSFSSVNGEKVHGSPALLTDLLKGELGFDGIVVSDWNGIDQIDGVAGFDQAEVARAVNAGIDMVMVPTAYATFIADLTAAVEAGDVPMDRIDDAVRRILTKKFELGLFESPLTDRSLFATVGSDEHRALAREAVAKSQVMLTNNGGLPIAASSRVLVTGSGSDDLGNQAGGWTITWQGSSGDTIEGTTILEATEDAFAAADAGGTVTARPQMTADSVAEIAGEIDVAIAVVGERPYAEFKGDRPDGVRLTGADVTTLEALRDAGVPTVVVVISGRPIDLGGAERWASAVVAAWLPGSEGAGVTDVLLGTVDPTGTLPVSWPATADQEPINVGDGQVPLFAFGAGLVGPLG
ncbi:beta-glucosidase [Sanguibacter gelidistatuariae]|uniref:beta-glucosidase n=1 Tax=Sanguibacter gelidistatuariae TaxID=1814289 RepID=A0A1G6GYJ9_9MICO|nr:glycoside hydrolase family 3 N-terminal domain-containing protein [Sanguibacter gelidistatuariae]SDB87102.1 beta-glucosidase [Sanguibacter gelidistatuariae]